MICWAIHPTSGSYIYAFPFQVSIFESDGILSSIHLVTVGILSSIHLVTVGILSSHPPRYSWIIIELASSLRRAPKEEKTISKTRDLTESRRLFISFVSRCLGMRLFISRHSQQYEIYKVSSQIQRRIKQESQRGFHDFCRGCYLHDVIKAR